MLRRLISRPRGLALVVAVLGLASLAASCGGGGYAAKDMVLVEFLFVDRSLDPTAPTGTANLPRNAQVLFVFSELVDPATANDQTVQIRYGPSQQSVSEGSFSVDGNTIRFDPTVTAQGQPNPFGFQPITQYSVAVPTFEEQSGVVRNVDDDPNLVTFFTKFTTSEGFLRELDPPEVDQVYSIPDRWELYPLTGDWPGNGIMAIEFSEPMDPSSFIQGGPAGPLPTTTVDIRYLDNDPANPIVVQGRKVSGSFTYDASATTYFFKPTFSWGTAKYKFAVQLLQGLRDLSGNLLVNPRSYGPFLCDGKGIQDGEELIEEFADSTNMDALNSDPLVEWGDPVEGFLQGAPIDTRKMYLYGYTFQGATADFGQYASVISPFVGASLNQVMPNVNPPTNQGRRVMWSFSDVEMGPSGSITGAAWGPDSNATYAAIYPTAILRCGHKKSPSLSLAASFSGNYDGTPTVVYNGPYQVPQRSNVGNTVDAGQDPCNYTMGAGCTSIPCWNSPLWDYTGFQDWPAFTSNFEWNEGDPNIDNDRAFLFDASLEEGDAWQQLRSWYAATAPCSLALISGFPNRRMYTTFEADTPNPPSSFAGNILNPEPSVTDSSFSITKRVSVAQCLFYTPNSTTVGTTFGLDSDYLDVQLTPTVQPGGATVRIEFQGAMQVESDRRTINFGFAFTDWTENIHDCDGFACIRWRVYLVSNLISQQRAGLVSVNLPVVDADTTN